ncbi:MAG TPA: transposase [Solirubrobacteraceae bacterium]|nr:transposase [Solirubrobacteraceae bacterium]
MSRPKKYPEELIQRGVRLALESGRPIASIAKDLGMHPETLRRYVRQAQAAAGGDVPSGEEREEIRLLRREVFELRRANEILKAASLFFARELDPDRPK